MKTKIKILVGAMVLFGAIFSQHQIDNQFAQSVPPELRIEAAVEDFILEYKTTAVNQVIRLPFSGATNVIVDWNDGSTPVTWTTGGELAKTMPLIGTYQIKITGTITNYGFGSVQFFDKRQSNLLLSSVIQWGSTGVVSLSGMFMGANNLTFVPTSLPATVTNISWLFHQRGDWATKPLTNISSWDTSNVINMQSTFEGASISTTDITNWNTGNVTNMSGMFNSATLFNQNIGGWNTSKVTNFYAMFERAYAFNGNIGSWNTSSATSFQSMFRFAIVFNQDISSWNTSNVTSMFSTFEYAEKFNQPLNTWDVSKVTTFQWMLKDAPLFNQPLNNWVMTSATNLSQMFESARAFNQSINTWDVSKVTTFSAMFRGAHAFNQPLDQWDVSAATQMFAMFESARAFNQNINDWNVSNVTNMGSMFYGATVYNQPLDQWNVGNVINFSSMFRSTSFNRDISMWIVAKGTNFSSMFESNIVYNQPLNTWNMGAALNLDSMFSGARVFNQPLSNWNVSNVTSMNALFASAWAFNQDISLWNTGNVTSMYRMFNDTKAFNQTLNTWNVSKVQNFGQMFASATAFNQPIGDWNTGAATFMGEMFSSNPIFDQYIGEWDTSKVVYFFYMFSNSIFNQDIGGWDTGSATTMRDMFQNNKQFNQDISAWNTAKVTTMESMFRQSVFNQPIGDWNVSKVTVFYQMFKDNTAFNQPIGNWNLAEAQQIQEMFYGATLFNQDLPWITPKLGYIAGIFFNAAAFDGDVSTWNTAAVTSFREVFHGASNFNQPLNTWNVANATDFHRFFRFATKFNQPLDTWNTSKVQDMQRMFENNTAFSQDLSSWDFSATYTLDSFMAGTVNLNPLDYDAILGRLASQTLVVPTWNRSISFGQSKYSKVAKALKDQLVTNGSWSISDGGELKLTITVEDSEKYFGEDDPEFTVAYTGLVERAGEDTLTNDYVFTRTEGEAVGTYTVSVTGGDESYYYVSYATGTFSILKPTLDLDLITWDYESSFTYDGTEKTVLLENIPAPITVTYLGNTATNAGDYTASVTISYDTNTYDISGSIPELFWVIDQVTIDVSTVAWDYEEAFIYTGSPFTVLLINVPELITVTYEGNTETNAGTYVASVSISYDTVNYDVNWQITNLDWIIDQATYDLSNVTWSYDGTPFAYDMTEKTVTITGGLPTGVTVVSYEGNKATAPGTYTTTVVFAYDTINYEEPVLAEFVWEIFAQNFTITFDTRGGSTISAITGIFGSTVSAPANPTKTGFTFNGWSPALPTTMPNANLTVTASWLAVTTNDQTSSDLSDAVDLSEFEGEDITLALVIEILNQETLSEADLTILKDFFAEEIGGAVESFIYDIRLLVETQQGNVSITELTNGFEVTLQVPEVMQGKTIYVVQYLDGVATLIEGTYDETTQTIRFQVNGLGQYVLAYQVNTFNLFTAIAIGGGTILAGLLGWWFFLLGKRRKPKQEKAVAAVDTEEEDGSMEQVQFFSKPVQVNTLFYEGLTPTLQAEFKALFVDDTPSHLVKELVYTIGEKNEVFFTLVYKFLYRYRKVISLGLLEALIGFGLSLSTNAPKTQTLIYEAGAKTSYARRSDRAFLDYTITLTRKDIALQRNVLNPRGVFVYSFYRLSIILEKQKLTQEALVLVNEAIARNLIDKTKSGYQGRKQRLIGKK